VRVPRLLFPALAFAVTLQLFAPLAMAVAHVSRLGCHPDICPMHRQQKLPKPASGKCCLLSSDRPAAIPRVADPLPRPATIRSRVLGSESRLCVDAGIRTNSLLLVSITPSAQSVLRV
jgi:hypothetical protein